MKREAVKRSREPERDARAHQNSVHTGKQGAVDGRKMGNLDLLEVIDAYRIPVTFLGKEDFDKVRDDAKFLEFARIVFLMRRHSNVGLIRRFASGNEEAVPNPLRHPGPGKMIEGAADVPARVAVLQSAGKNLIECRAGDNAQLAEC